jgi:hypothetical protein
LYVSSSRFATPERARESGLEPKYIAALHDLTGAYYMKAQSLPDGAEKLDWLDHALASFKRVEALQANPAGEILPKDALSALQRIADWVAKEKQRMEALGIALAKTSKKPAPPAKAAARKRAPARASTQSGS